MTPVSLMSPALGRVINGFSTVEDAKQHLVDHLDGDTDLWVIVNAEWVDSTPEIASARQIVLHHRYTSFAWAQCALMDRFDGLSMFDAANLIRQALADMRVTFNE